MIKSFCFCCLTVVTGISWANSVVNDKIIEVKPFTAKYNILHKGSKVGKGIRKLIELDNEKLQYSYQTDIEWLIFSDNRKESSVVSVENGHVTPWHYQFTREGTGRDKHYEWQYDVKNNKAKDLKKKRDLTEDFPNNIQDKLSYHLQNRLNLIANPEQKLFVYPVISTSGKISNHVYQFEGEEEVMLPYGLVKTVKLKREVIEKKRITYAWFAPELDYLLVKLYQTKGGVEQFEAQLTSVTVNDTAELKQTAN